MRWIALLFALVVSVSAHAQPITQLPAANLPLVGTETVVLVQAGTTKQTTVGNIPNLGGACAISGCTFTGPVIFDSSVTITGGTASLSTLGVSGTTTLGTGSTNSWTVTGNSGSPTIAVTGSGNQFAQLKGLGTFGPLLQTANGNVLLTQDSGGGSITSYLKVIAQSTGNPVQLVGNDATGIQSNSPFLVQHNWAYSGTASSFANYNLYLQSAISGTSANISPYAVNFVQVNPSLQTGETQNAFQVWSQQQNGFWGRNTALVGLINQNGTPTPPGAWQPNHAYATTGSLVYNGTNEYQLTSGSCTSAGSGGPTGTGSSITDNTCTWKYETNITQSYYQNALAGQANMTKNVGGSATGYVGFVFGGGSVCNLGPGATYYSECIGFESDSFNTATNGPARQAIHQFVKTGNGVQEDWGLEVNGASYNALIFQTAVMPNGVGIAFQDQNGDGLQTMAGAIDCILCNATGQFVGSSGYMLPGGGGYIIRSQNTSWLNSGDLALGNALFHIGSQSLTLDTGQYILTAAGALDGTGANWPNSFEASDDQGNIFTVTSSAGVPASVAILRTVSMASCPAGSQLLHALSANGVILDTAGGAVIPSAFHVASETCQQGTTLNLGTTTATAINIGNSGSNTTLAGTLTIATSTTGAATQTFTNSPCSGLTSERWVPVAITGQTGTWYVPACQ